VLLIAPVPLEDYFEWGEIPNARFRKNRQN
jgi:hypothetical protein